MNTFAKRLRDTRNERKLSQAELARLCGLSQSAIANYEARTRANPKDIFSLADALGVNPDWLARGTAPRDRPIYVLPGNDGSVHLGDGKHNDQGTALSTLEAAHPDNVVYAWPFRQVKPSALWALTPEQRQVVDDTLAALLQSLQASDAQKK